MMDEILLPDENTQEMAVDCPDNFLSKNHHEAEGSMVSGMSYLVEPPPPTPLDGSMVNFQARQAVKNIEGVAEVAAGLPQPEMNFTRIHRLRESYQRQEIQQKENKKLQAQNTLDDGAMKLERLKSAKNRDRNNSRPPLKGVENTAFVGEAGETGTMKTDESVEQGIQDMLTSLNQVSQHVSDEDLIDEMIFIKRLLQDDSFKVEKL